jgi:hypothetical protein
LRKLGINEEFASMREAVATVVISAGVLVLIHVCSGSLRAQAADPTAVLAGARTALGGETRIAAVKTFIVTGRTRQIRGANLVPIEFEMQAELPDKYSRRDEIPAQDTGPTTNGFNGDALVQIPKAVPPPPRAGGPPPPTPEQQQAAQRQRVVAVKQDFARLMLGMFAMSYPSFPLTFTYVGQAEAPQGKADVLDAKGPANFTARLFINADTHLPIMVSWQQAAPPARRGGPPPPQGAPGAGAQGAGPRGGPAPAAPAPTGAAAAGPSPATAPREGPPPGGAAAGAGVAGGRGGPPGGAGAGPPPLVEHRLYYAEYRDVDGLKLPFRVRHAVGGDTTEETTFDRFRINARVDPKRFDTD